MKDEKKFEKITDWALRKGVFFPTAEVYPSHLAGFWEYGPIGTTLKRKVIDVWRKEIVERANMLEIDGCNVLPEVVFRASGHLSSFQDPLTKCKKCKNVYRADKLIEEATDKIVPEAMPAEKFDELIKKHKIKCPCGDSLEKVKMFNLMIPSPVGPGNEDIAYLRPETCQTIFLDFNRLYKNGRVKLPIGIAQVGKCFRNEISPRNAIYRVREINQMEIEVFFNPKKEENFEKFSEVEKYKLRICMDGEKTKDVSCKDAVKKGMFSEMVGYYLALFQQAYEKMGIPRDKMRLRRLMDDEKAFYAKYSYDFEILTSLGWSEIAACNYRTDHDLKGHAKGSGQDISVDDEGAKITPWIWEMSAGVDRSILAVIDNAYVEEEVDGDKRTVLKLKPNLAPTQVAVFPLVKKDGLREIAQEIYEDLRTCYSAFYDESGSIGRRYRRMDEIGTILSITVDYQTKEDDTVTVRDRDSMHQVRVNIKELKDIIWKVLEGQKLVKLVSPN